MSLYSELKRRGVLQAGIAYTVFMWLLIQVASILLPAFNAPEIFMQALIVLILVGFPITVTLAWVWDLTPQGIKKTDVHSQTAAPTIFPGNSLNYSIIGFLTAAVVLFALDKFIWKTELGTAGKREITLAVLPFQNMTGDSDNAPFTTGIHDDLLTQLSKIRAFKTISRTSVSQYQDSTASIPDIAKNLGANTVLEGGVQRSDDRIRVNAQLIEAENDTHIWAETYDRQLTAANIFAIQSEISRTIASELKMTLSPAEEELLENIPTHSLAAYDAYTAARMKMDSTSDADLGESVLQYTEATRLDPNFAAAWAGLCEVRLKQYRKNSDNDIFESAVRACEISLDLDPTRVEVYTALGGLYRAYGDYSRAESSLQKAQFAKAAEALDKALDLDDRRLEAKIELSLVYASQGQLEKAETKLLQMAEEHPNDWSVQTALYSIYYSFSDQPGHYELAARHATKVTQLRPDLASAWNNLGSAQYMLQQYDAAARAWRKSVQIEPNRTAYTNSGLAFYNAGQFELAAQMQRKAAEIAPKDHRVWGRLAEALRHGGGASNQVIEYYEKAANLAAGQMQVNDQDWQTLQMQALYTAHSGNTGEAIILADRAIDLSGRRPKALFFAALTYLESGAEDTCLELLRETLAKDQSYGQLIASDPDLIAVSALERLQGPS